MGYKKTTIHGIGWISLLQLGTRLISLLKVILVAKILSPYDFGLFAIVTTILALVEVFTETSMQTFLIQNKRELKQIISSAWIVTLVRGVFLFFIMLIAAFPVSLFFQIPFLFQLLLLSAVIPLIKSLENPYVVSFQKELRFKIEFIYKLVCVLVDLVASVTLVVLLHSVVGLVLGLLISITVGVVFSWVYIKQKPKLHVKKKYLKEIRLFMNSIVPMNIMNFITNQFDILLIGRVVGPDMLGVYQISQKFSSQPLIEASDVFGKVTLPVYAKISDERKRLLRAYKKILLTLVVFCTVGSLALFISSHFLISFLGPAWDKASDLFPILLGYGFFMSVWGTTGSLFLSLSAQRILTKISFVRFIITLPIVGVGIFLFGIIGAAWGLLLSILLVIPITLYYFFRFFREDKVFISGKRKSV